ncbi:MAG: hypothetical protein K2Y01_06215 [Rhabdochlamydiaceae bacterium]|nr:hypothetical protein [Rhabdochlamydiaceae bacterium]
MQALQNFFYKAPVAVPPAPPALMATKPMHVSSEKELLEQVAERINGALVNQEMSLTFLPEPYEHPATQEHPSYTLRFGYHENDAVKLPILSHSFFVMTKKPIEPFSSNSCNRSIRTNEGRAFYKSEGTTQKWLTPATVDKIDTMIRAKMKEMNPSNDFASKEEISKSLDLKFNELEQKFKNIRQAIRNDPLFAPAPRRLWML